MNSSWNVLLKSQHLTDKVLTVGLVNNDFPGLVELQNLDGPLPGICIEITKLICESLSYVCKFEISSDTFGIKHSNGSWTGVLGDLRNEIYNTSAPYFSLSNERMRDFSFSTMGTYRSLKFYTRAAGISTWDKYSSIFKPFSYQMWTTLILTVLTISIVAALPLLIRPERSKKIPILIVWTDMFLTLLVYLARKGPKVKDSRFSTKILLTFWGFASVALTASYTCGLLSAMLKSTESLPFHDLKTLANCIDEGKCQMIKTPTGDQFFAEVQMATEFTQYFSLKTALAKYPIINVTETSELVERILNTKDKFLVTWPTSIKLSCVNDVSSQLKFVLFTAENSVFPFRQGDPLKRTFDGKLFILYSTGLIESLNQKYLKIRKSCDKESPLSRRLTASPLHLQAYYSPFLLLTGGLAVSILVLLLESMVRQELLRQFTQLERQQRRNRNLDDLRMSISQNVF